MSNPRPDEVAAAPAPSTPAPASGGNSGGGRVIIADGRKISDTSTDPSSGSYRRRWKRRGRRRQVGIIP